MTYEAMVWLCVAFVAGVLVGGISVYGLFPRQHRDARGRFTKES